MEEGQLPSGLHQVAKALRGESREGSMKALSRPLKICEAMYTQGLYVPESEEGLSADKDVHRRTCMYVCTPRST